MSQTSPERQSVSRQSVAVSVQPRWIAPAALAIALIAVAVAAWALLSAPKPAAAPQFSAQQATDARGRACAAYETVRNAVGLQTHTDLGQDPMAVAAVAANSRLAMSAGASYLLGRLDPATPAEIVAAGRSFADELQDISMYAQAGVSAADPAQAARLRDGETASAKMGDLCR